MEQVRITVERIIDGSAVETFTTLMPAAITDVEFIAQGAAAEQLRFEKIFLENINPPPPPIRLVK